MSNVIQSGQEWPWASVFIEVSLRAIRRVHYEYGMWGVGRQREMSREAAGRINTGRGIELADERAVCAAITQEFIGSPSLAGRWVEPATDGTSPLEERYFEIDREMAYATRKGQKVDLFVRKHKLEGTLFKRVPFPSFIEAKRARIWTPDISTGGATPGSPQIQDVREDIGKLKVEIEHREQNSSTEERIRGQVLVWGIYGQESYHDHPVTFFNKVGSEVRLHALRWLPLGWPQPTNTNELQSATLQPLMPTATLWLALAEVVQQPRL